MPLVGGSSVAMPRLRRHMMGSLGLQRSPFVGRACATSAIQGKHRRPPRGCVPIMTSGSADRGADGEAGQMGQFGVGQSVRRKEDDRLLTGRAQFQDDVNLDGQAHAAIFRSPHAPCQDRCGRNDQGGGLAGRPRGLHRSRRCCRRAHATPLPRPAAHGRAQAARRHGRLLPAAPDHLRDAGQACRRPGGDGGRRDAGRGARRGGADRCRLYAASRGHRDGGGRRS